jgi:hypothetical protein
MKMYWRTLAPCVYKHPLCAHTPTVSLQQIVDFAADTDTVPALCSLWLSTGVGGFTPPMGVGVFPHLRVSAGTIPVGNAIDVWRMCLRVTLSHPNSLAKPIIRHGSMVTCARDVLQFQPSAADPPYLEGDAAALPAPVENRSPAVAAVDGCIYLDAQQVN